MPSLLPHSTPASNNRCSDEHPWLLEEAPGRWVLAKRRYKYGTVEGVVATPFSVSVERGVYRGYLYRIDRLYWGHVLGLLFVQGAALQRLIGPNYALLRATPCKPYDPRPHIRDVALALVTSAPSAICMEELLFDLRSLLT